MDFPKWWIVTFPDPLRKVATSLENQLGRKVRLEELFRRLLERLEDPYELFMTEGFSSIFKEWKNILIFLVVKWKYKLNRKIKWFSVRLDHVVALVHKLEDGNVKRVFIGDI